MEKEKSSKSSKKTEMKEVKPLKDFTIVQNEHKYELKKGEAIEVPKMFLQNLKTEKVIK
jgi:hypothetical protein